jgi:hypothetical protein
MKIGKTFFMVLLTALCLAIMVVSAIPIGGGDVGDYDPMLDINHDGKIDMTDIGTDARAFLTSGDPTVPVNVTNLPLLVTTTNLAMNMTLAANRTTSHSDIYTVDVVGYKQVTVGCVSPGIAGGNYLDVFWVIGGVAVYVNTYGLSQDWRGIYVTFAVQGEQIRLRIAPNTGTIIYSLGVYATQ